MPKVKSNKFYFTLSLFLLIWITLGLLISEANIKAYDLQHRGSHAVGENGTFVLVLPGSDTFMYKGQCFANKQPGTFVFGGIVCATLKLSGLTYTKNYILTAALVAFFASSAFAAGSSTLIFLICNNILNLSLSPSILAAVFFAFGTTYGSYATILHHDVIAGFFPLIALYLSWASTSTAINKSKGFLVSFLATLTLSFSTLYSWSVLALIILMFFKNIKQYKQFILGITLASIPWFTYNYYYFDSPFTTAVHASMEEVALAPWSLNNIGTYLNQFFGLGELSLLKYSPVLLFCILGLLISKSSFSKILIVLGLSHLSILLVLPNAHWHQQCQYGPRYLFPFMCYVASGAGLFFSALLSKKRYYLFCFAIMISLFSIAVNIIGALFGTMNCGSGYAPYKYYLNGQIAFTNIHSPLFHLLLLPFILSLLFFTYRYIIEHRISTQLSH